MTRHTRRKGIIAQSAAHRSRTGIQRLGQRGVRGDATWGDLEEERVHAGLVGGYACFWVGVADGSEGWWWGVRVGGMIMMDG